jgi:hypothetical protein
MDNCSQRCANRGPIGRIDLGFIYRGPHELLPYKPLVFFSVLVAPALLGAPPATSVGKPLHRVRNDGDRPVHVELDDVFGAIDLDPGQEVWTHKSALRIDGA